MSEGDDARALLTINFVIIIIHLATVSVTCLIVMKVRHRLSFASLKRFPSDRMPIEKEDLPRAMYSLLLEHFVKAATLRQSMRPAGNAAADPGCDGSIHFKQVRS
jgi:hypothetical protein